MSEDLNQNTFEPQQEEEMEIDLMELARKLWANRKVLYKAAGIGALLGIVIALSTPKKYTVDVILSPEVTKTGTTSLSNITSMLGLGNSNLGADQDAFNITMFPQIAASTPFVVELFDVPVVPEDEEQPVRLWDYMDNSKGSWLGAVLSLPGQAIGAVMSLFSSDEEEASDTINVFHLTKDQSQKVEILQKAITADVDKKTGVTTVSVTMNDPVVTATLADSVVAKLQDYVTRYRVAKAQNDCDYYEMLYKERQQEYYEKQALYAQYVDANKGVILHTALTERDRLQNDANLAYQVYSQVATQLQAARAKVQEAKPVFAVVQPATVPIFPSGMSRKVLALAIVILSVGGTGAWILFGRDYWEKVKAGLKESPATEEEPAAEA
jgi:hypothetical protein